MVLRCPFLKFILKIAQAYGLKLQTEHFRIHRDIVSSDGKGKTMGALQLQMNDVWIAPTRSTIGKTAFTFLNFFILVF